MFFCDFSNLGVCDMKLVSEKTYERYVEIRKSKGLRDADISKKAGIPQSTFSDWKKGKSTPKVDKLLKIAEALEVEYTELVGNFGKYSILNPDRLERISIVAKDKDMYQELINLYKNATPDAQTSVMTLLKNSQKEPSKSSKEA